MENIQITAEELKFVKMMKNQPLGDFISYLSFLCLVGRSDYAERMLYIMFQEMQVENYRLEARAV